MGKEKDRLREIRGKERHETIKKIEMSIESGGGGG
jgi:hypothetical protein